MLRKILILILLVSAIHVKGQTTSSYRYIDSLTYRLYTENKWEDLIREGEGALNNGLDYYYLRMRVGVAFYERHQYVSSSKHFRKALVHNENDQLALEYLFYSILFSGHSSQALALLPQFYPQNREKILTISGIKNNSLTIESFYSDAFTEELISRPDSWIADPEPGNQIASKYFVNNAVYANHNIGFRASYFHAFTSLIKDNHLHYFDGTNSADLLNQRVMQSQYYGSFNIYTPSGWTFSPSFHFLTTGYPLLSISTKGMILSAESYKVRSNSSLAGLAISKSFGYLITGGEVGYYYSKYKKQVQGTVSIMIYPLGNTQVYFGGKISAGQEPGILNQGDIKIAEGFTAGFSIARKVWFEFSGLAGDLNNYIDNNGLFVYNSADILKSKLSGRIIVPFQKTGLSIFAGGGMSSYFSEFMPEDGSISSNSNKIKYSSINITGGISWNF